MSSKQLLHTRNPHVGRYDFKALIKANPQLKRFVKTSAHGDSTINFADDKAVLNLNKALLTQFYGIQFWQIPDGYLCPPIPGRADYIHYLADLLADLTTDSEVSVLDIGTGANCIYPIIGSQAYGWHFVGTDVNKVAINSAKAIVKANKNLHGKIEIRPQNNQSSIFDSVIKQGEYFSLTMCNPPFHASKQEAKTTNQRKQANLTKHRGKSQPLGKLNFGGQQTELWCKGGEIGFLTKMVKESKKCAANVGIFTSLVSKKENLYPLKKLLKKLQAEYVTVIEMRQGQKISRFIAWRFV